MENTEKSGFILTVLKGSLIGVIGTLVGVLIFAGLVKATYMDVSVIKPVNQFIKILSIFLGAFFSVKGRFKLLKGAIIGVVTVLITYLIFAIIGGGVSFGLPFVLDLIFGLVVGGITGVIRKSVKE